MSAFRALYYINESRFNITVDFRETLDALGSIRHGIDSSLLSKLIDNVLT